MVRFTHVNKIYADTGQEALKDVSFQIKNGEFYYITGESGAGKSTIIKMLLGEEKPDSGTVEWNGMDVGKLEGKELATHRRNVGVLFQDFRLIQDATVFDNVALPLKVRGTPSKVIQKKVAYMLSLIGMSEKYKRYPSQLSGGEQQKVCLARAIISDPGILLADEPTANLDVMYSKEVAQLLEIINQRGTTVIMVTHNTEIMNKNHEVIKMEQGKII